MVYTKLFLTITYDIITNNKSILMFNLVYLYIEVLMLVSALEQIIRLFNSKNISYSVLLCITIMCGYFVYSVIEKVMRDNTILIKNLESMNSNLKDILESIKDHEKHEQARSFRR